MGNAGITSYAALPLLRFSTPGSDFASCPARSGAAGVIRTLRKHLKEAVLSSDILPPNVIRIMKSMSLFVVPGRISSDLWRTCSLFYVCGNEHQHNTNPSAYAPYFWSTLPPTHPVQTIWSTWYVMHLFQFLAWPKIWRHTFKMRNEISFSELRWSAGVSYLPLILFLERCRRDSWTVVLLWACWRGESGCLSSSLCQTFEGIWPVHATSAPYLHLMHPSTS